MLYKERTPKTNLRGSQSGGYLLSHNIPQCSTIGDAVCGRRSGGSAAPLSARLRLSPRCFSLYKFPPHTSPYTSHFFIQVSVLACINFAQFLSITSSIFYTSLPLAIPRASDAFFFNPTTTSPSWAITLRCSSWSRLFIL